MVLHKHHIIPRHAGGENTAENIRLLTIAEHAEEHRLLWETHGRWQDRVAYLALSGQISGHEAAQEARRRADKSWTRTDWGRRVLSEGKKKFHAAGGKVWNHNLPKDHPHREKSRQLNLKSRREGKLNDIGEWQRKNPKRSREYLKNLSEAAKRREKIKCVYCLKDFAPGMHSRWHGEKCKLKLSDQGPL